MTEIRLGPIRPRNNLRRPSVRNLPAPTAQREASMVSYRARALLGLRGATMLQTAPPPQLPLTIRRHGPAALQSQIAEQIRRLVSNGNLGPTSRVPSTRALSEQLGVSRNTVSLAYDLLIAEGILEVESSAGTMVSRTAAPMRSSTRRRHPRGPWIATTVPADAATSARVHGARATALPTHAPAQLPCDFRLGQPDPALFPHAAWRKLIVDHVGRAGSALVRYGDPGGLRALRVAIAAHLRLARARSVASPTRSSSSRGARRA